MIHIRPASLRDALWVAWRLRKEDEEEVRTASGLDPLRALPRAINLSEESHVACWGDSPDPFLIFGITSSGSVWLLATDEVKRGPKAVLKEAKHWVDTWAHNYGSIHALADMRNHLHIRWLKLLGFTLGSVVDVNGFPFQAVTREGRN